MKSSSGESIDQGDVGKFTHIGIGAENQGKTCHPRLTGGIIAIFTLFDLNYRLLKFLLQLLGIRARLKLILKNNSQFISRQIDHTIGPAQTGRDFTPWLKLRSKQ